MLYLHILLYYIFSALWFSPLLVGKLWMKLLKWDMKDIQSQSHPRGKCV